MEEFDNYFKIINLYIQNLKDQKGSLYPLQDLARKLYSGKYYNQAMKLFTIIVDNYPDAIESKSDIGAIFVQQGEIIKAKSIFQEVSKLSPEDIINLKNYYITLLLTKDFNNAYNVKSSIEKLESGKSSHLYDKIFLSILLKKDYKFYIKEYLKKRELEIKDKRNDFWYQSSNALLNYENLSTKDAVELLEGYLIQFHQAKYTDLSLTVANIIENIQITNNALIVQTAIYDQYNYYEQTIKYLDKIKKRKETDPTIMSDYDMNWNYGRIQYAKEKYDLAKDYFLANQKNNKKDAKINYYLGKCYLFLGKKKEAKELFEFNSKMNDKEQMYFINYSIRELKNL
jgi:tetratricopeptide (TPR) repeat protein